MEGLILLDFYVIREQSFLLVRADSMLRKGRTRAFLRWYFFRMVAMIKAKK